MTKHFRVDEAACKSGDYVSLAATDAHHLATVLRATPGTELIVVDRSRQAHSAVVESLDPLVVRIHAELDRQDPSPTELLEVWVPLLKGGRTDPLVRQLTELGASRCVVFESDHSVVRLPPAKRAKRLARLQAIALEATKQCGRYDAPDVIAVAALDVIESGPGVVLHPGSNVLLRDVFGDGGNAARVVIGPEGGISARELNMLAERGLTTGSLGPRVLRAETAVLAATILALHSLGEGGY